MGDVLLEIYLFICLYKRLYNRQRSYLWLQNIHISVYAVVAYDLLLPLFVPPIEPHQSRATLLCVPATSYIAEFVGLLFLLAFPSL